MARVAILQTDATNPPLPDGSADLVIGSPPYLDRRSYGIGAQRSLKEWVAFMEAVTLEALRVTGGKPVLWVVAGTGGSQYCPGPEALMMRMYGLVNIMRPAIWSANKPPTRGWFVNVWEYVLAFGTVGYFDVREIAKKNKFKTGGRFRQRRPDGTRNIKGSPYPEHDVRRTAENLIRVPVGGGRMGHKLAHENEAPYPVGVPEYFIRALVPPGGVVYDPFAGSGTTAHAAHTAGRHSILSDLRENQCELSARRMRDVGADVREFGNEGYAAVAYAAGQDVSPEVRLSDAGQADTAVQAGPEAGQAA